MQNFHRQRHQSPALAGPDGPLGPGGPLGFGGPDGLGGIGGPGGPDGACGTGLGLVLVKLCLIFDKTIPHICPFLYANAF